MLSNKKHVSTLPSYVAIINGILPNWLKYIYIYKPEKIEIQDKTLLKGMTWAVSYDIEYNTIGACQTSNSNMPGYYIVWWTGNEYTLQEKYTCHAFYPLVIIT